MADADFDMWNHDEYYVPAAVVCSSRCSDNGQVGDEDEDMT